MPHIGYLLDTNTLLWIAEDIWANAANRCFMFLERAAGDSYTIRTVAFEVTGSRFAARGTYFGNYSRNATQQMVMARSHAGGRR